MLWLAFAYPLVALVIVLALTALAIWLIPKLWRAFRRVTARVSAWFGGGEPRGAARAGAARHPANGNAER